MMAGAAMPRQEPDLTTTAKTGLTRFGEAIRGQFRQLMQRLTRPAAPQPRTRRRRTEDIRGGFKLAARNFLGRTIRAVQLPSAFWDTLTWLRHWESQDRAEIDGMHQNCDS